jgi:hypothetical protein
MFVDTGSDLSLNSARVAMVSFLRPVDSKVVTDISNLLLDWRHISEVAPTPIVSKVGCIHCTDTPLSLSASF